MNDEDYFQKPRIQAEPFDYKEFLKKVVFLIIFGFLLSLKYLIGALDEAGKAGLGLQGYFVAIAKSIWHGLALSLGSMWAVISNFNGYFANNSWGSIIFTVFSLIILLFFFYQPISFIFSLIDAKTQRQTNVAIVAIATIIFVLVLSCIVYYIGGRETLASEITDSGVSNDVTYTSIPTPVTNTDNPPNTSTTISLI